MFVKELWTWIGWAVRDKEDLALSPIQSSRNSQSCVCSIGCSANWGRAVGRSFLEGRSYVRGKAPNLNRLSRARKNIKNVALSPIQSSRNSQSCVCLIGCSANWGRAVGRSYIRGRAPNLNRLSRTRKIEKTSSSTQFSVRVILSRVYVQLDARPIKKDCKKVVSYIRNLLTEGGN